MMANIKSSIQVVQGSWWRSCILSGVEGPCAGSLRGIPSENTLLRAEQRASDAQRNGQTEELEYFE
jgi:hypothetical protein